MSIESGIIHGKGASPGIALGKALLVRPDSAYLDQIGKLTAFRTTDEEITRLNAAIATSKAELEIIRTKAIKEIGEEGGAIFDAHLMMIEDPEMISSSEELLRSEKITAEVALERVAQTFIATFQAMDDEYLRERATDVRDVSARIIRHLMDVKTLDLATLDQDVILVAHDLTPSQTATMNKKRVLGILTNIGGKTSHTAILARTLEIPAVLGLRTITEVIKDGDSLVLNGETGEVILHPEPKTIEAFREKKREDDRLKAELKSFIGKETVTRDGRKLRLEGNIASPSDTDILLKNDGEGVGLFRTEFLYMDHAQEPSEEEQFEAYKSVLKAMNGKPTIIRTLDVGGDKNIPYLKIEKEENPFLGCRAIRYCLKEPKIFRTQLRALLRASVHAGPGGELGIMFPMISSLEEVKAARKIYDETRAELKAQGVAVSDHVKVGIMIEIPSAAVIADLLAKHVDFFSIGTNDLIQYVCAVDRMNENVVDLYDQFHPAVLRLIKIVIDAGHRNGISVGMCGEMAGTPELTEVLLGMGLIEFSMSPSLILRTRKIVRELSYKEAQAISERVLQMGSGEEIREFLSKR